MKDLHNGYAASHVLSAAVRNADANSAGLDLQGCEAAEILVNVGASADTLSATNTISLELEESDDNSTFTDVAEADLLGAVSGTTTGQFALIDSASEDEATYRVGYIGTKRYVRVVVNFSGTHTTGTPIGALAVKGHLRHGAGTIV